MARFPLSIQHALLDWPLEVPGYHGRYVRIDLSAGVAQWHVLPADVLRRFLGGSGLGTALLLGEQAAKADPFDPENPLIFSFSPLVGSPLTTSAKFAVLTKGPLTARLNDSLASSRFALSGKRFGADALVITGKSNAPSILVLDHDQMWLEEAGDAWGADCHTAQQRIRSRLGGDFQVAVIGPAGERQVRYATISHDGRHAGRGGSGAVMGSKRLKAIAVRGNHHCRWHDPERLQRRARRLSQQSFGPATAKYRHLGTAGNLLLFNRLHTLPTRNFQAGSLEGAEQLSVESLSSARRHTRASCAACTIGCEHIYSASPGPQSKETEGGVRLEYESLFALGPLCGINDPDTVLAAAKLCDSMGLDTISTGATIAFAMECSERGLLRAPWLRFGRKLALQRAIWEIVERRGVGDRLAEGTRRLADSLGGDAATFAPHVKGLEIPGYEPRTLQTMALGFAVATRGADHNRSGAYQVDFSPNIDRCRGSLEAVPLAVETEDQAALLDALILCKFLRGVFSDLWSESAEMLQLVTGWDVSGQELRETARRIITAKKWFNILSGWTPDEDTLPRRFLDGPLEDDPARLDSETLRAQIRAYNRLRGWSDEGWVPAAILDRLQLAPLAAVDHR